jgi:hypothetical protein
MAQEGAIVRNKTTGAMGRIVNGQVVPIEQAPQAPVIAPPDPYRQAAEQRAQQDQTIQQQQLGVSQGSAAISAAKEERDRAEWLATHNPDGSPKAQPTFGDQQTANAKSANLDTLVGQINRVQQLYDKGLRDEAIPILSSLSEYLPTPSNKQFDAAAAGMAEQGLAAFRVPGVGSQSDTELRQFVEANKPNAGDYDSQIEEKLRQLRLRVDNARQAAGLPPAQWGSTASDDEAVPPPLGASGGTAPPPPAGTTPPINGPLVNSEGQIAGNTHDNGGNGATGIARGEERRVDNPILAGVRDEYLDRLGRGDSAEQLIKWAKQAGVHPSAFGSIQAQVKFRREHPEINLSEYDTSELDDKFVPLSQAERQTAEDVDTPLGAYLVNAGDAASGFTLDNMVGLAGGNAERARLGMGEISDRNPVASMAGTITGGAMAALGGEAALGMRGVAAGLPRALAADSAYGAAAGAGGTDDGSNRLLGAGMGAVAGAGGSLAGYGAGNALVRMARGVSDPSVNALRTEGVNALTVGQTYGNSGRIGTAIKSVEDRLSGLPVVGDMVNSRRSEGVRQFNSRAFDKALEPIGGTVGDVVGEEAVERAQQQVSQAFTAALAGKGAAPDQAFVRDLSVAVQGVRSVKRIGDEITDEIGEIMRPYSGDPLLSGEALDDISRGLRDLKGRYMSDPLGVSAAKRIDRVERAVFDLFDRQASGTVPEYMAARQAYRRLSVLEDAVLKARNQKDRVFSAAQLGQSDRGNAKKFGGKRAAARGDTPFHDYQTAGQDVLPNSVPDSGTAGRLLVPLALVGGGAGADQMGGGGTTGLTIGAILAALYSRTGQRLLTKPGRGMKAGTRRRAAMENPATRRALAATGAAGSAAALTGPE